MKAKKCKQCHGDLKGQDQRLFCTKSCAATHNNTKRLFRGSGLANCANCGISMRGRKGKRFCGTLCQKGFDKELAITQMMITKICHEPGSVNLRSAKLRLISLRGHRCEICGIEEWNGQPAPLVFDHIDGNAENGSLNNCRLVCGNCDMQLDTYKAKNKGNGRHWRNQRRAEGKSF